MPVKEIYNFLDKEMKYNPFLEHLISLYRTPAFVDAVGTGAIFGPIVACAVTMPFNCSLPEGIDDSKKLPHETIYRLAPILKEKLIWAIGIVSSRELLKIRNNLRGELLAMARAVIGLKDLISIDSVFVDGKYNLPKTDLTSIAVVRGDQTILGIAAASIIAKDYRDHFVMDNYGKRYSRYHINSNKGYRSPDHLISLRKFGPVRGLHRTYLPQIKSVMSGGYDSVIFSKYKDRWDKL